MRRPTSHYEQGSLFDAPAFPEPEPAASPNPRDEPEPREEGQRGTERDTSTSRPDEPEPVAPMPGPNGTAARPVSRVRTFYGVAFDDDGHTLRLHKEEQS